MNYKIENKILVVISKFWDIIIYDYRKKYDDNTQ